MNLLGRILIADSDESVLLTTTDLLQRAGYQCTPVRDGLEAFRELELDRYDLLLTEIGMPGNEGLELVWAAYRYAEGMPVIIYTQSPSLRTAIAAIQLRVAAYLTKPVEMSLLIDQVKTSIASYQDFKTTQAEREGLRASQDQTVQIDLLTSTIRETIQVLESTRSSFKSKKLAALRRKLERLLAREQPE